MATETESPPETRAAATDRGVMPHRGTALLGTMISATGASALVRLGTSEIRSVAPGDRLGRAIVMAIEPGVLHLSQSGQSRRLVLPGN